MTAPDDDQPSLFDLPRARRTDPDTAHEAAASLSPKAVTAAELTVLRAIVRSPVGMTWRELTDLLEPEGWERQTISPRFAPLKDAGLIEYRYEALPAVIDGTPTVTKRKITRPGHSGRRQSVLFATRIGEALIKRIEEARP